MDSKMVSRVVFGAFGSRVFLLVVGAMMVVFARGIGEVIYNAILVMNIVQAEQIVPPGGPRAYVLSMAVISLGGLVLLIGGLIGVASELILYLGRSKGGPDNAARGGISLIWPTVLVVLAVTVIMAGIVAFQSNKERVLAEIAPGQSKQIQLDQGTYTFYYQTYSADSEWADPLFFVNGLDIDVHYDGETVDLADIRKRRKYQSLEACGISLYRANITEADQYAVAVGEDDTSDTAKAGQVVIKTPNMPSAVAVLIAAVGIGMLLLVISGYLFRRARRRVVGNGRNEKW